MQIMLTSSPVLEVGAHHFQSSPADNVWPPVIVECAKLADVLAAIDAYTAVVAATGRAAVLTIFQAPRDRSRKVAGFDKATARPVKVNFPTVAEGETVKCAHPVAPSI